MPRAAYINPPLLVHLFISHHKSPPFYSKTWSVRGHVLFLLLKAYYLQLMCETRLKQQRRITMSSRSAKTTPETSNVCFRAHRANDAKMSAFSSLLSRHIYSSPCQDPKNSDEKLIFSSSLLFKTFIVWLHVCVPPQNTEILNYAVQLLPDTNSLRARLCRLWPAASVA